MNRNFKIILSSILGIAVFAMSDIVSAQVFSPRAGNSASTTAKPVQKATTEPAVQNVQQNKPEQQSEEENEAPAVKKNFSSTEEKKKYNNSSPKVVSFKIINGEMVLDEDKERSILVYYDNYQVHRGLDEYVRCSIRVYVLNDLRDKISSIGFKLYWPEISTAIQMNQLNPGVRTYKDIMLMGDGCFALDTTPTIEVNRCRVKGMSQDKCADAVRWYEKP
ncbi:MAG: hypothetical protein IKO06_03460 [Alphaproteobacteria bacterium]|nr:hypothetical protein [Alphaproteobacteria bacterium]